MMCDSDAVQDMVDGEEAQAATTAQLEQLAGITCPDGNIMSFGSPGPGYFVATCWNPTTKRAHGPGIMLCANGKLAWEAAWLEGQRHGLSTFRENCGNTVDGECYDLGTVVWACNANGMGDGGDGDSETWPVYECSTREEAEALAAEHGCP